MDELKKLCEKNFFTVQNIYPYGMLISIPESERTINTKAELENYLLSIYVPQEAERIISACPYEEKSGRLSLKKGIVCGAGIPYNYSRFSIFVISRNEKNIEFEVGCESMMSADGPQISVNFNGIAVNTDEGLRLEKLFGDNYAELLRRKLQ